MRRTTVEILAVVSKSAGHPVRPNNSGEPREGVSLARTMKSVDLIAAGRFTVRPADPYAPSHWGFLLSQSSTSTDRGDVARLARANLQIVASGDIGAVAANVSDDFWDMQGGDTPAARRGHGPDAFAATVQWLHRAFTDVHFDTHRVLVDGDRAALYVTMHARQHGPFVVPGPDGADVRFESRGRTCHVRAVHMFRIAESRVVEHDAVRDDLTMARQLGWIPAGPPQ
jgi:predicted ester cyclase